MSEPASPAASNHTNGDTATVTATATVASGVSGSVGVGVSVSSPSSRVVKPVVPAVKAALTMDEKKAKLKAKEEKLKAIREQRLAKEKADRADLERKEREERERIKKEHGDKLAKERKLFAAQMKKEAEEEKTKGKSRPTSAVPSAASTPSSGSGVKVGFKIKELTGALKGLKITSLTKDGPAHRGGLEVNDIIKQVNGKVIHSMKDWKTASAAFRPSTSVPFVVLHNGSTVTVIVHFAGVASVAAANNTANTSSALSSPTAAAVTQ